MKYFEINLNFIIAACSIIVGCSSTTRNNRTIEVASYFAGKDEVCLNSRKMKVAFELKKVIQEINVYGDSDNERYCTFIGETTVSQKKVMKKFSVSSSKCKRWLEEEKRKFIVKVSGDHICEILF